ncbi:unnamed protein product [Periconia digitata]|uniref:Conidiation-specific protein 13 n=1 Tax=Periconia digitata TaxID=1303443 RepID=A0A9W4UPE2_9PLEO|nr:unnamed protein product [Periconia digitata]
MVYLSPYIPALLVAAATAISAETRDTHAKLDKPTINDSLDYLKPGLNKALKAQNFTKKRWDEGWIPQSCKDLAKDTNTEPKDFEIWDVTYADCPAPWVFCHHKTSGITIESIAHQFSKVPLQMRQYVRHIVDVPSPSGWAFETSGNIVFNKPDDDMLPVILHETGHALDLEGAYNNTALSSSAQMWDNYNQDKYVSDKYAASNMVENVAQNTVIAVFNENVEGGYEGVEKRWREIFRQYATVIDRAIAYGKGNNFFKPGMEGVCTHRLPPSPRVRVDGRRSDIRGRRERSEVSLGEGIVPIISKREGRSRFSNCSISW